MTALSLTKISIIYFYLRIFKSKRFRLACYAVMTFAVVYLIAFDLVCIFQCHPVHYAWDRWDGEHQGTCLNANAVGWSAAGLNMVLDIATISLPLRELGKLQLSWDKKIPLMLLFLLGFL